MSEIQKSFEKGVLKTLKEILKRTDLNIKYEHHGAEDPYFTHTVKDGKTEIFYLKYAVPGTANESLLRIKGKKQKWSLESIDELHQAVDKSWWAQEYENRVAKEQDKAAKIKKEQEEMMSFLSEFVQTK